MKPMRFARGSVNASYALYSSAGRYLTISPEPPAIVLKMFS